MAREVLDHTLNSDLGAQFAKLNEMLTELYAAQAAATPDTLVVPAATLGDLVLGQGLVKTASATAGAATLTNPSGTITTEALTTAAGADYTLTITNTEVAAADIPFASLRNGTNTQGLPLIKSVNPNANQLVIIVRNAHASEALNGTLEIAFGVLKV